ncbi:MAG: glycosyltransferase family 4 protein [Gammaproteobacteria bacterium]|nr:glycosyltransferase family 4 protein [Gammaproteobacteria bacterium]
MRRRLAFVTTSPFIVQSFLTEILRELGARYDMRLVVNLDEPYPLRAIDNVPIVHSIPIERKVDPFRDLVALYLLFRLFRAERFAVVHTVAPKAGLLGMVAAWLARVPVRVHTFQGEVWATRKGLWRSVLKWMDKITAAAATHILVISDSERVFLEKERVLSARRAIVLANGSISGVDTTRFRPNRDARAEIRRAASVDDGELVFLYTGRITRDKGVQFLLQAFRQLRQKRPGVHLFVVGPDEDTLLPGLAQQYKDDMPFVHAYGYTDQPEKYMAAADVICLPSQREGFGLVLVEAAAVGIPSVASRIYGIVDAVEDGVTGLLHGADDVDALARHMLTLANDAELRRNMGQRANERAVKLFSQDRLLRAYVDYYADIAGAGQYASVRRGAA